MSDEEKKRLLEEYLKSSSCTEIVLGRTYDGNPVYYDFKKRTHLLISGTTGSGKSVFIDSVLINLIYKASPEELKFILIDTHALNLLRFNKISHLIFSVITDAKKVVGAMAWVVAEMDYRYKELSDRGAKNIEAYNEMMEERHEKKMPRILIVIDDLADVMTEYLYLKDLQADLDRLVSMSRAVGIHLLLSVQRPSSESVSNAVKMNIPNRIAFRTVSGGDSRLIIHTTGAERLTGNGEMLFTQLGQQEPIRIQGPYVSDEEIDHVVKYTIKNNGFYAVQEKIELEKKKTDTTVDIIYDNDEFLEDAGKLIIKKQKASVGMIQREFRIGFNRAARIMDRLAEMGVVGPEEGIAPRKILVDMEGFERLLVDNKDNNENNKESGSMSKINIDFFEEYKHLEKICNEIYQQNSGGVTLYINDMEKYGPSSVKSIPGWYDDLKQLKQVRHIRNIIAHEGSFENDECNPSDITYVRDFYNRILKAEDPLALVRKTSSSTPNVSNKTDQVYNKTNQIITNNNTYKANPDNQNRDVYHNNEPGGASLKSFLFFMFIAAIIAIGVYLILQL